ncbi:MAG: DUF3048 domain-containing protein [Anaerolineae bacterium]|nr:DUF3048 domain-containing protein [Anaerolineae bacterium]
MTQARTHLVKPILLIIIVLSLVVAPQENRRTAQAGPLPDANPPTGTFGYPEYINPLTGLAVNDPTIMNRRPVLTKVSNYPPSGRPHAGLSYADIVFEYYIGEYTNRFLALYYSNNAPSAWPLRSGRLIDPQLTLMYGGILVYGNADPRVDAVIVRDLGERALSFNMSPCPPICGDATHSVAGVYVDTAAVSEYADRHGIDNQRPNLTGMLFDKRVPTSSQLAISLEVNYISWNRGEWRYDADSHRYLRWIESWDEGTKYPLIPLVDKINGQQIAFDNIVLVFSTYVEYNPTLHDVLIWDSSEPQRAILMRDGIIQEGFWQSIGRTNPIRFTDEDGMPMRFRPGNTWMVIVDNASKFDQIDAGQWQLLFDLP